MSKPRNGDFVVEKQRQLSFGVAMKISLNSVKIRFWRAMITASGILLGIAFLATILTQGLLQWPMVEKLGVGLVKVDGQVNGPGEYYVYKPIPVSEGLDAGIPKSVIKRVAPESGEFQLALVQQGMADYRTDVEVLKRLNNELKALDKVKPAFYSTSNGDPDIRIGDAVKAGVPEKIAKRLAGTTKIFKASSLADAIKNQPLTIETWQKRRNYNSIFGKVDQAVVDKLGEKYSITLNDAIATAKKTTKDADLTNIRLVNAHNRRILSNFEKNGESVGNIKLKPGDNIVVSDQNSRYRMYWLVIMSLMVSAVGITNSMLMSVTERFKEIGTMKCLGALDGTVVIFFILESGMLGIAASIMGWVVGFVTMIVLAAFSKGWSVIGTIGIADVLTTFGISVGVGMILTMLATIAPALRAANMPAAMALRSEI